MDVDELDIDKLKTFPVILSKVSKLVNNGVIRKTKYNRLGTMDNAIYTS